VQGVGGGKMWLKYIVRKKNKCLSNKKLLTILSFFPENALLNY